MGVGIIGIGAYVPYYRLERKTIGRAWERGGIKGERSVANTDEDSITMAVQAAIGCLDGVERSDVDALYFASTTHPYAEKSSASMIAAVCDLRNDVATADYSNTPKAGSNALRTAIDAVKAKSARQVIVTAADCRNGYPKSDQEQLFGDAAAAVLIGENGIIAELVATYSVNTEIIDVWRNDGERYVNYGEGRFITDKGYTTAMTQAVKGVLKKTGMKPEEFQKIVLSTPGLKDSIAVAKKTGLAPEQLQDSFMMQVGDCGAAQALFGLAGALETANPGDYILMAAYGNGADAFIFQVTPDVRKIQKKNIVQNTLNQKRMLESYTRYLSFRGLVDTLPGEPFRTFPSNAATWREQKGILRLYGSRCKQCGQGIFPINRICISCGSKDEYEEVRLSDRIAKVFTYSIDNLAGRADDPVVVQTVADDSEGIRYYLLMTDFNKNEIKIGMEVEFTFRRIYEGSNFINYYWKCRPVRNGGMEQ